MFSAQINWEILAGKSISTYRSAWESQTCQKAVNVTPLVEFAVETCSRKAGDPQPLWPAALLWNVKGDRSFSELPSYREDAHTRYSWDLMWWRRSSEGPGLDMDGYVIRCCEAFLLKNTETWVAQDLMSFSFPDEVQGSSLRPRQIFTHWITWFFKWMIINMLNPLSIPYSGDYIPMVCKDFFAHWEATYISKGNCSCSLPQAWPNRSCGQMTVWH